jgi:hypothetical protein
MLSQKLIKKLQKVEKKYSEAQDESLQVKAEILQEMIFNEEIMIFDASTGKCYEPCVDEINVNINGAYIQISVGN